MVRSLVTAAVRGALALVLAVSVVAPPLGARSQALASFPIMPLERVQQFIAAAQQQLDYLPGEVLVKFRDGVGADGRQRALMAVGSRVQEDGLRWIGNFAVVRDASRTDARELASAYAMQPEVEMAEPNYLGRTQGVPNDPSFNQRQWNLQQLKMPAAWDIAGGGTADVTVAVLDSGITAVAPQTFSALTWNGNLNPPQIVSFAFPVAPSPDFSLGRFRNPADFSSNPIFPGTNVIDSDGHGTHTASTVGESTDNGVALAGMAYNATIMPVKVCTSYWDVQFSMSARGIPGYAPLGSGGCDVAALVNGIFYAADNGANVINISLGGFSNSNFLFNALQYAVDQGVFIAISNGNSYASGNAASYPAAFAPQIDGVMSVAAVDRNNNHAWYSTSNAQTEITAYGGDVRSSEVNGIWQVTINFDDSDPEFVIFPRFDRYEERGFQGTSMAAPHVAGLAALLHSRRILSPEAKEAHIIATARDLGPSGRDNDSGHGLIQPRTALFGFGIRR